MPRRFPAPLPPIEMPPARTVLVPGRGEFFLRDSGLIDAEHATRPAVMLLHGWTASADLNWWAQYNDLIGAGYRVLAIDHRGHGRGLRSADPFRISDCAADAAAVLRTLGLAPAIIVGYSMGGAIAQTVAREHSDVVGALILSGTAQGFTTDANRRQLRALPVLRFFLAIAPTAVWRFLLGQLGWRETDDAGWIMSEMLRHNTDAIIEAGRELNRFDSRPWLAPLPVPAAVVLTTKDDIVPPAAQQQLAQALKARVFEAPIRHMQIGYLPDAYNPALIEALAYVCAEMPNVQVGSEAV